MENYSEDATGWASPTLVVYSLAAVAYCALCGVKIAGMVPGNRDRKGFILDSTDGRAKIALDSGGQETRTSMGQTLIDIASG